MSENNKKKVENSNVDQEIDEKIQFTEEKQNSLEEKLKESEDKLLRSLAEIENQRRRFEKEIKDAFEFGSYNFAKESLAILDNLQRAREAIKNDGTLKENKDLNKFIENINIIEKDLINIFEKNRIKKIETSNKKFDPNLHQAMSEIEDEKSETGNILQEIQAGYMLGERLLRPALVSVAKKKTDKKEEKEQKKEEK
ncbi:nucleotide exchange factor GrpE [Pelagibacteraceae bacterium]|jgi:molecular chaperone GrpE|nr:nucleotide exchange factor GrpE [Pelagibacteraceae bacterium]